jgi:hypothetical protein
LACIFRIKVSLHFILTHLSLYSYHYAMPSIGTQIYYALVVAWGAGFYQLYLREVFSTTLGFGRVIQSIDEFPYDCRRVVHPRLEACEDLWLDNEARVLYAACSGTAGTLEWRQA